MAVSTPAEWAGKRVFVTGSDRGIGRRTARAFWVHDQHFLDRPGNAAVQLVLFRDYATNPRPYPMWQLSGPSCTRTCTKIRGIGANSHEVCKL